MQVGCKYGSNFTDLVIGNIRSIAVSVCLCYVSQMDNILKYQDEFIQRLSDLGKSFNTIKNYRADLRCFNNFVLEKRPNLTLKEFSTHQAQEYTRFLYEKYQSDNSRRRRVQALRIFFDYLIEQGKFDENPIKKVAVSPKVLEKPTPASYHEIIKLIEKLHFKRQNATGMERLLALRNTVLVYFIYGAGLKVSDISKLKKGHILKSTKKDEYRVMVAHPKRDPYTILLPKAFAAIYQEYCELLERQKGTDNIDFEDILFNANPFKILAGGLSPRGCEVIFKDFSKSLGIKITPRSLRQSCIFKWIVQDHPHGRIKEWMGVRPVYSLKPYLDVMDDVNASTFLELREISNVQ